MISLILNNRPLEVKFNEFSDGAIAYTVNVPEDLQISLPLSVLSVSVHPNTPASRVSHEVEMVMSCLADYNLRFKQVTLNLPYLPYSRADRKFNKGMNIPLNDFLNWLEGMAFDEVIICDPHNPKALEEYEYSINFNIQDQLKCFRDTVAMQRIDVHSFDAIVAPDKGAAEKAQSIADFYGLPLIVCTKERDPSTGKLSNPKVNGNVGLMKLLIVDDLSDGNGTFAQLGETLINLGANSVSLYVTHLIAARGLDNLRGIIDNVFYHQIVGEYVSREDVVKFNKGE